jgi:hypothetical protein
LTDAPTPLSAPTWVPLAVSAAWATACLLAWHAVGRRARQQ